jgi:phenylpyruvate tautomerase PptA (4-oxalocrotonate tautomerase family)
MPVVTIKAKQKPDRTPEKIDALMAEVRQVIAKHLELPVAKVMVVYEENSAGIYWDGESARASAPRK